MLVATMLIHCVILRQPSECYYLYAVQAHICVCYTIVTFTYFHRNEVMDCLLRKFHDLPTACRTILRKEQREQVIHICIHTVHAYCTFIHACIRAYKNACMHIYMCVCVLDKALP